MFVSVGFFLWVFQFILKINISKFGVSVMDFSLSLTFSWRYFWSARTVALRSLSFNDDPELTMNQVCTDMSVQQVIEFITTASYWPLKWQAIGLVPLHRRVMPLLGMGGRGVCWTRTPKKGGESTPGVSLWSMFSDPVSLARKPPRNSRP